MTYLASDERMTGMPRYRVQGTIPYNGRVEKVDDVYEARNEKEANRKINAAVQAYKKEKHVNTVGKPDVTITLES